MSRTSVPGSAATAVIQVHQPSPLAVLMNRALDLAYSRSNSGRAGGRILVGEPAAPTAKFSGDLGPLQHFRGAASLVVGAGLRPGLGTSLPNATGTSRTGGASLLDPLAMWQTGDGAA